MEITYAHVCITQWAYSIIFLRIIQSNLYGIPDMSISNIHFDFHSGRETAQVATGLR